MLSECAAWVRAFVPHLVPQTLTLRSCSRCHKVLLGRIGNRSPEWEWLKDKEGKSPRK